MCVCCIYICVCTGGVEAEQFPLAAMIPGSNDKAVTMQKRVQEKQRFHDYMLTHVF